MEVNDSDGALRQIEAGLKILEQSGAPDHDDLKVWGTALQSRLLLKSENRKSGSNAGRHQRSARLAHYPAQGSSGLRRPEFRPLSLRRSHHIIRSGKHNQRRIRRRKTIEAYFNLGMAYVKCDQLEKAEKAFEQMLYDKHNPNQVELIYYYYGMAQLLYRKGEKRKRWNRIRRQFV